MAVKQEITENELDELCELACLYLDAAEKKTIAVQLNEIIAVLGRIQEVDTIGVGPTVHPTELPVFFREDQVEPSLSQEQVFRNTAHRNDSYFRVPRIAGEESGKG